MSYRLDGRELLPSIQRKRQPMVSAEATGGPRSEQDSDYDGAWEEAARHHWAECLATYFPAVHATIDWRSPVEWFDEELSQILAQAGSRNK